MIVYNIDVMWDNRGEWRGGNCVCKRRKKYVACVIDGTASTQSIASIGLRPPHVLPLFPVGGNAWLTPNRSCDFFLLMSCTHPEACTHQEYFHKALIK